METDSTESQVVCSSLAEQHITITAGTWTRVRAGQHFFMISIQAGKDFSVLFSRFPGEGRSRINRWNPKMPVGCLVLPAPSLQLLPWQKLPEQSAAAHTPQVGGEAPGGACQHLTCLRLSSALPALPQASSWASPASCTSACRRFLLHPGCDISWHQAWSTLGS